ncbi:MAG: hypothetical protein CM1200mP12_17620 [Gammaproteobacteria bacterium]|nr:MAG: hypothetical protein CM1200mP12_17620 [Gammaproteobacteria bacterium]
MDSNPRKLGNFSCPDVLEKASPKLLHKIWITSFDVWPTIEGFGLGAPGRVGDQWGSIKQFRTAYDKGEYERVKELSANLPQKKK